LEPAALLTLGQNQRFSLWDCHAALQSRVLSATL
jgi:hypothetical protein